MLSNARPCVRIPTLGVGSVPVMLVIPDSRNPAETAEERQCCAEAREEVRMWRI